MKIKTLLLIILTLTFISQITLFAQTKYTGGNGDGYADGSYSVSLPIPDDNKYAGGDADGYASGQSSYVLAKVKIWLEGPYSSGSMTTALKTAGYIPAASPYSDGRTVSSSPDGIADWVLVELRSTATGDAVSQKSFFLKNNGSIVDLDGSATDLTMYGPSDGDYYIVARHRNHLTVMSASAQSLISTSSTLYDFTVDEATAYDKYYGGDAKLLETGPNVYGMYAGDADGSGTVDANDRADTWNDRNATEYDGSDCCMTGTCDANDRATTWNNRNKSTNVPTP